MGVKSKTRWKVSRPDGGPLFNALPVCLKWRPAPGTHKKRPLECLKKKASLGRVWLQLPICIHAGAIYKYLES